MINYSNTRLQLAVDQYKISTSCTVLVFSANNGAIAHDDILDAATFDHRYMHGRKDAWTVDSWWLDKQEHQHQHQHLASHCDIVTL